MNKLTLLFTAIFFTMLLGTAQAQNETSLKPIMLELEVNMEAIVRALNYDDFAAIKTRAMEIADHAKPPKKEMKRILTFLGKDAENFKKTDKAVHDSAVKLAEAASEMDHKKVVKHFNAVLNGCVECHSRYRSGIVEHMGSK